MNVRRLTNATLAEDLHFLRAALALVFSRRHVWRIVNREWYVRQRENAFSACRCSCRSWRRQAGAISRAGRFSPVWPVLWIGL